MTNEVLKKRREHFKKRSFERYGLNLNRKDINEIVKIIQSGNAKFICRESSTKLHYRVTFHGQAIRAVYSTKHRTLLTALPPLEIDDSVKVESLDKDTIKHINAQIQNKGAMLLERASKNMFIYAVRAGKKMIRVYYSRRRKSIFDLDLKDTL